MPDDTYAPTPKQREEREELRELWFTDMSGESLLFHRMDDGAITRADAWDVAPEEVLELAPDGWTVWEGTRRQLTAEEMTEEAMEEAGVYYPSMLSPGDWWWEGELRPATVGEVVAFFGLRTHSPEETEGITEEREPVYVYMPSHWRETIREHPDALIGFHYRLSDHDAEVEEWERVEVYSIGQPLGGEGSDG